MANKRMFEAAARKFVDKVENGLARDELLENKAAYRELKEALEAPEDTSDGQPENGYEHDYERYEA